MITGDLQTLLLSWRVQGAGPRGRGCLLLSQGRPWEIRAMCDGTDTVAIVRSWVCRVREQGEQQAGRTTLVVVR